jgi:hypothetical protein
MKLALKTYDIISAAVERGVYAGHRRAHKHMDEGQRPSEVVLCEVICRSVLDELCEVVDFNSSDDERRVEDALNTDEEIGGGLP